MQLLYITPYLVQILLEMFHQFSQPITIGIIRGKPIASGLKNNTAPIPNLPRSFAEFVRS